MNRSILLTVWALVMVLPQAIVAEEINVTPGSNVVEEIERNMGGPPKLYRQGQEYIDEYKRYGQYDPKITKKNRSFLLELDSLQVPFEVEVSENYVTTLTFLDARGLPYPTRVSRVGNAEKFKVCTGTSDDCKISEGELDLAHILTVTTPVSAGRSNLKVFFRGLHRAVQIPLVVEKRSYHAEVTIMVPLDNPDAEPSMQTIPQAEQSIFPKTDDSYARALIDGVDAEGAVPLQVSIQTMTGDVLPVEESAAVKANGNIYVKTRLLWPNPTPTGITRGFHGYVVYRFQGTPRAVSGFEPNGSAVILKLTQPEEVLGFRQLGVSP